MTKLDHALRLAGEGFYVFPVKANAKTPLIKEWQKHATRETQTLYSWFEHGDANIGIYTGKFGDDEALLVVDVDIRPGKDGNHALIALELEGLELPETRETATPSGGKHLFFQVPSAVRQGADVLGSGLDVRSRGGYVVGAGSTIEGREYRVSSDLPIAPCPAWLVERLSPVGGRVRDERPTAQEAAIAVDPGRAQARAIAYLTEEALCAVEGQGGDDLTFRVACRLKDFGVGQGTAAALMDEHWNPRCSPPWPIEDLIQKVENAYAYGENPPGVADPAADFQAVTYQEPEFQQAATDKSDPLTELNKEFAWVIAGGGSHIIWETTDAHGRPALEHLSEDTFHKKHASLVLQFGKKTVPATKEWMNWSGRRSYDGLAFDPGGPRDIIVGDK